MKIREWLRAFFRPQEEIDQLTARIAELEQGIRCRDHALASLSASPAEELPPVTRSVFRQKTYTELQREFERTNSSRFREIDARHRPN